MKNEMDGSSSAPPPRKLKFAPKIPPRKTQKTVVPKVEPSETKEETIDKELLMKLRTAKTNDGFGQRKSKNEKEASSTQVAFGPVNSLKARSFPLPRDTTTTDASSPKIDKEYAEPWDYTHTNYPVTLPLRRPYSGNPELLDEEEFGEAAKSSVPNEDDVNAAEQLGLMEETDEPQFLFFQLPAVLPLAKKPDASADAKKGSNKTVLASKLEEVPEGRIGKILVYKSGKVKMKLGDLLFDVSPGANCVFAQDVAVVDTKEKQCCIVGELGKRVVVTPDINSLLGCSEDIDVSSYP
ncbi:DNA-directed RNA polymerase III subunit RPC4-like [Ananas comosus]|uniref:DNA-directed RNA polymerase III subunit RPC4-like n=1 Tax=Ananas comosus TaxID=4615 RepID=A0A6P5FYS4_ANACO|nr:DNA-directed RNA polymerase III subunit RPC4-like [Ananas comosus]XP_020101209.1 DNA-directed RNA polymerase III subunit RPC4-like [Ananas comosus]